LYGIVWPSHREEARHDGMPHATITTADKRHLSKQAHLVADAIDLAIAGKYAPAYTQYLVVLVLLSRKG
jgi:hypothetical protein